ncbi:type VI secretion system-associated protein TagF [Methylobacterium sp. BTF04]|uniref:type VI secretion system-associated protein TagF n=1 Tax=Methylobacterium sp. BTF04 TaxID=2708300 RepID=UPI0013D6FFD0|nr:type VI secretion system-associated protein TagF [Methylobacterium sp. BTF04]NEU11884.1 type VI secretion system-associated protein TagF [Methylobacterium sp. BTF04]
MPCGLYGKLPAKRDFIALGTPRAFLSAWEPWIQGGLSASRADLGEGWAQAYLHAPIWRFWLGADIAGEAVLGAFMPSVDGIGRYFPLTLIGRASGGAALPPPHLDTFDAWFAVAETFLLATLSDAIAFEAITAGIGALPDPAPAHPPPQAGEVVRLRGGALIGPAADGAFASALAALTVLDHASLHAGMSYWWSAGGEGFPALAAACRRMPDPHAFAALLTGRFDAQAV